MRKRQSPGSSATCSSVHVCAVDALDVVARQIVEVERAALALREVTQLAGEIDAALGVVDRLAP